MLGKVKMDTEEEINNAAEKIMGDTAVSKLGALNMLLVVQQGINPIIEEFGFSKLQIKIGIDSGENAIVEYAFNIKNSHVDIIGYPMNIAAKITSLAKPNHILIGIITYRRLDSKVEHRLRKLGLENIEYIDYQTGDAYSILSLPLDNYF